MSNSLRSQGLQHTKASLSFTIPQSLLKLMTIKSVMPSNHLILCHPLLFLPSVSPSITVFPNESVFFASGGQSIGVSASTSVLPMNTQGWFPLGLTGWSPCCPRDSQESSTPQFFNFYFYFILLYNTVLVLPYIDMNPPRVYMRSQTWIPPPTSLPITSLWVITVHQPQACCMLHRT